MRVYRRFSKEVVSGLRAGRLAVIPTDTLYGLVASVHCPAAINRVYKIKKRQPGKPCIVLIASPADLVSLNIRLSPFIRRTLQRFWPGPVSIVLPGTVRLPRYLHRGTKTLAVRLPGSRRLRTLLAKTGPLIAPSANPEKKPPAVTIQTARQYFGNTVDFYIDGGKLTGAPSALISIQHGGRILRPGAIAMKNSKKFIKK